jgi:hypothetical protein
LVALLAVVAVTLGAAFAEFATASGQALARAHARSGDAIEIDAYIGNGGQFDRALSEFASNYARQTTRDHQQLKDALASGAIESTNE